MLRAALEQGYREGVWIPSHSLTADRTFFRHWPLNLPLPRPRPRPRRSAAARGCRRQRCPAPELLNLCKRMEERNICWRLEMSRCEHVHTTHLRGQLLQAALKYRLLGTELRSSPVSNFTVQLHKGKGGEEDG